MERNKQVFTNCTTGGPVKVYVKDGKIISIEPLEFGPRMMPASGLSGPGKEVLTTRYCQAGSLYPGRKVQHIFQRPNSLSSAEGRF